MGLDFDEDYVFDAEETRRDLKKKVDSARELRDQIADHEKALPLLRKAISSCEQGIQEAAQHILIRYGGVDEEKAKEEVRAAIRGTGSPILKATMQDLECRAEEIKPSNVVHGGERKWSAQIPKDLESQWTGLENCVGREERAAVLRGLVRDLKRRFRELNDLDRKKHITQHRLYVARNLLSDYNLGKIESRTETRTSDSESVHSPERKTRERVVIAHRIVQDRRTKIRSRNDLDRLLREFIKWHGGTPPNRPTDAIWKAIGYAPGRGKGDIEDALELLHDRVTEFEQKLGELVVKNMELIVDRWIGG